MGFIIAVATAVAVSLQNTRFRKLSGVSTHFLNWARFIVASLLLAILVTLFTEWDVPPKQFWFLIIGLSLPLELLVSFFYVKAFQISPQSLVGPLFSFSVVFLVPLGFFLLGELPTMFGIIGVLLIFIGSFYLGSEDLYSSHMNKIKNIFKEKGSYLMIAAALFAASAVSIAKFSFQYATPLLFAFYITLMLFLIYTPIALKNITTLKSTQWRDLFFMSITYGIGIVLHYIGLSLLLATYFISIKRLSIVLDVLYGRAIHKEEHFRKRLVGVLIMVGGVVLIVFV